MDPTIELIVGILVTALFFFMQWWIRDQNTKHKTHRENHERATKRLDVHDEKIKALDKNLDGLKGEVDHVSEQVSIHHEAMVQKTDYFDIEIKKLSDGVRDNNYHLESIAEKITNNNEFMMQRMDEIKKQFESITKIVVKN